MPTLAILIGLQASGKTTFYQQALAPEYVHVSKDNWPNARRRQERQMRLVEEALAAGLNVAVDNTNPTPEEWRPLAEVARRHGAKVVGYWFPPDVGGSLRRNATRTGRKRVPDVGIFATKKRLRRPRRSDGFDELYEVRIDGEGGFHVRPLEDEATE
jgi:predicted kinase